MKRTLISFFNPTNAVFSLLLLAFVLVASYCMLTSPADGFRVVSIESPPELVVRSKLTHDDGTYSRYVQQGSDLIPITEADPDALYDEVGRVRAWHSDRLEMTGVSADLLFGVIPWFLIMLAFWPLFAALRARRWVVAVAYLAALVLSCWRSWQMTWQHVPYDAAALTYFNADPLGVWIVFLLLALAPKRLVLDDGRRLRSDGRVAAVLLINLFALFAVTLAVVGPKVQFSQQDHRDVRLYRMLNPDGTAHPFHLSEFEPRDVPYAREPAPGTIRWEMATASSGGGGAHTRSLKPTESLLLLVGVIAALVALTMWPYRILARKGRDRFARGLMVVVTLAGTAVLWLQRAEPPEPGFSVTGSGTFIWVIAMAIALTAAKDPPNSQRVKTLTNSS